MELPGAVTRYPSGYQYIDLANVARFTSKAVNIFGVITEWEAPRKTKNDFLSTIKLVDPSLADPESDNVHPVHVLVFAPNLDMLPRVRRAGDIIRLHRVRVNEFNNRTQLVASLGGLKQYGGAQRAAFCLFDGISSSNAPQMINIPYQKSSATYHFDDRESAILAHVRSFVATGTWKTGDHQADKYLKRITDVISSNVDNRMVFADLVAFVLARTDNGGSGNDPTIVWVWDGTDAPPYPSNCTTGELQSQQAPNSPGPASSAPQLPPRRVFPIEALRDPSALPAIGTAVPVHFMDNSILKPLPGTWVKLRNCGFRIAQGQLQGVLSKKSRWIGWHEDEGTMGVYAQRLAQRLVSGWAPNDVQYYVSECWHQEQPITSLRRIATDMAAVDAQPTTYRCLVRVLKHWPEREFLTHSCVPAGSIWEIAQAEGYTDPLQMIFAVRLLVEDGTGNTIDVDIFGKDAEEFFSSLVQPQDFKESPQQLARLAALFDTLTTQSPPPWLDMSIKTYLLPPKEGEEKPVVRYRVFDTRLKEFM